jgi:hypothetical protein
MWHMNGVLGMTVLFNTPSKILGGFMVAIAAIALLLKDRYG